MKHSRDLEILKETLESLPDKNKTHHVDGQLNIINLVMPILEYYEKKNQAAGAEFSEAEIEIEKLTKINDNLKKKIYDLQVR